jgi:hypothetical protein
MCDSRALKAEGKSAKPAAARIANRDASDFQSPPTCSVMGTSAAALASPAVRSP